MLAADVVAAAPRPLVALRCRRARLASDCSCCCSSSRSPAATGAGSSPLGMHGVVSHRFAPANSRLGSVETMPWLYMQILKTTSRLQNRS